MSENRFTSSKNDCEFNFTDAELQDREVDELYQMFQEKIKKAPVSTQPTEIPDPSQVIGSSVELIETHPSHSASSPDHSESPADIETESEQLTQPENLVEHIRDNHHKATGSAFAKHEDEFEAPVRTHLNMKKLKAKMEGILAKQQQTQRKFNDEKRKTQDELNEMQKKLDQEKQAERHRAMHPMVMMMKEMNENSMRNGRLPFFRQLEQMRADREERERRDQHLADERAHQCQVEMEMLRQEREERERREEAKEARRAKIENHRRAEERTLRRESSSSSWDSGLRADCSHSTTHSSSALTSSTSFRRDRLENVGYGNQRSLWCELPEVKNAGLLETLDKETKQLQEAYFEVITSEASYLRSLNILITHFMADKAMLGSKSSDSVISNDDRKHLFSNIFAVRDSSERLLVDLETRLDESLVLDCICDILMQHFDTNFDAYIKYCSNQVYQDRTIRRLKTESSAFLAAVSRLEADKQCHGLDMRSFLMLPMQRITRYPLLISAILERQPIGSESHRVAARTLALANQVVSNCNEGVRRMERTEQLLDVDRRLFYEDNDLKRIPLVTANRHLVKQGCLYELSEKGTSSLLHSLQKAPHIYLFLFSDLLLIAKQKMNGTYVCQDYAKRCFVDTSPLEPENPKIPCGLLHQLPTRPHLFSCVLMQNARGKQSEWLLSADSESDREHWLSAMRPPVSANPEEKVYAEWDCPQAMTMHAYSKAQDDELDLSVGEHVNILRKMSDGWFYGERVRDGVGGWFPSNYVQQLINDHTRAKEYRRRLRFIKGEI